MLNQQQIEQIYKQVLQHYKKLPDKISTKPHTLRHATTIIASKIVLETILEIPTEEKII